MIQRATSPKGGRKISYSRGHKFVTIEKSQKHLPLHYDWQIMCEQRVYHFGFFDDFAPTFKSMTANSWAVNVLYAL